MLTSLANSLIKMGNVTPSMIVALVMGEARVSVFLF